MPSVFKYNGNEIIDSNGKLGASTMDANQACVKTALNASNDPPIYACRAWVNFNGNAAMTVGQSYGPSTTPNPIRGSGNVSSITDHGAGQYSVNFTTAMPDANYATTQMAGNDADSATSHTAVFGADSSRTTSAVRFRTISVAASGSTVDEAIVNIAIFR